MAQKPRYWLADPEGVRAPVEGAELRDHLIQVNGWTEADEPDRHDFVWVRNEDPALGAVRMSWEAAQLDAWAGRGWTPGVPDVPGAPVPAAEPIKTTKPGTAAADKKE
ncbi:hypothetical protein Ait01nite_032210 [Actinoplanes italicus]|uniref:Uncharacterized protein n=1 Tax=Actinoplanes italicus TaxID=113567 RepID=A0A2T0KJI3_9ACTN|nr:hypothetical protein [Actinoplanes italicus]PRX23674.1 hypothetical protein CLV67_103423 [Actinoplanes italicus]GIE30176.1 hypothetical protein Ait01nite_032210 [Actinoplanes italicus]